MMRFIRVSDGSAFDINFDFIVGIFPTNGDPDSTDLWIDREDETGKPISIRVKGSFAKISNYLHWS